MVDIVALDERLALGFTAVVGFSTNLVEVSGGFVRANQNWPSPRHEYQFSTAWMDLADVQAMVAFFKGRRGRARAWLLKDWLDYELDDEVIGTGDGAETDFQIIKTYDANNPLVRNIVYLKSGTLIVRLDGTPTAAYTIASGLITFNSAVGNNVVITVSGEFYVPVRFGEDVINAEVNGQNGTIASISGMTAIEDRA